MKPLLLLSILLTMITTARADQKEEDAAIQRRHDEWCAAWGKHDPKLMAAFFTADGDLINPFGRHARGTAEIEKLFGDEHAGPMAGTVYKGTIENIRYLRKNVAIIDVAAEISGMKGPNGAPAAPFKHHVTWIAEKKAGQWMADGARAYVAVNPPTPAK
jgi:uncharacterized protein (TIGR02246 family)